MNIREHIINNFKGDDYDSLRNAIDESIKEQDEVTLPGMGVFFEIVWNGADDKLKDEMLEIIKDRVTSGEEQSNSDDKNQDDNSSDDYENNSDEDDSDTDNNDENSDDEKNYDE